MKNIALLAAILAPTALVMYHNDTTDNAIEPVEVMGFIDNRAFTQVKLTPKLPDQLECLALNAYHEARGEGERGMIAVTNVVLNRVKDNRFPQDALYYVNVQKVDLKRHKWIKGLQPVKQIGNHTFYKDKGQKA